MSRMKKQKKNHCAHGMQQRIVSMILVCNMAAYTLTGCGLPFVQDTRTEGEKKYPEMITIDVFDSYANVKGLQRGWFAQTVKDKFNMQLNIIAPNQEDNGRATYETMRASGKLGDLIISNVDEGVLQELVREGQVLDMTPYLDTHPNLKKYKEEIENVSLFSGTEGAFAVPSEISSLPATDPSEFKEPTNAPFIRWDLYKEVGYPEVDTLEDLIPVLSDMQNKAKVSDSGNPVYAFSLFRDWDAGAMQNAGALAALYGYDTEGFLMLNPDTGDIQDLLQKDSMYLRALDFLFEANQAGLVDPESKTQRYDTVASKMKDGAVLYSFWPWMGESLYNSDDHLNEEKGFATLQIKDASYLCWGNTPGGKPSCCIMIGKDAKDPDRLLDFVDWLYSPEGIECCGSPTGNYRGPEGLTWEDTEEGPKLTEFGEDVFVMMDTEREVEGIECNPRWDIGTSALNYKPLALHEVDDRGIPYCYQLWQDYIDKTRTSVTEDWMKHYNTNQQSIAYLLQQGNLTVMPGVYWVSEQMPEYLKTMEEQCRQALVDYSWSMVFAADRRDYERLKGEMTDILIRLGYREVIEFERQQELKRLSLLQEAAEVRHDS